MTTKKTSPHRVLSTTAVMLISGIFAAAPTNTALAALETHSTQGAVRAGTPISLSSPGVPVQYANDGVGGAGGGGGGGGGGDGMHPGRDGVVDPGRCGSTDEGEYIINQGEVGKTGGGYWWSESDETGEKTYSPYGSYRGAMAAVQWKDHPTERDGAALFVGGSFMIGQALPWSRVRSSPVKVNGVRGGVEIDIWLGEAGVVLKDAYTEYLTEGEITLEEHGLSGDPVEDLAEIFVPDIKISGALLHEVNVSTWRRNPGANIGGGHGRFQSGSIDVTCMVQEGIEYKLQEPPSHDPANYAADALRKASLDAYVWYEGARSQVNEWYDDTKSSIGEKVNGAVDALKNVDFEPPIMTPWGR